MTRFGVPDFKLELAYVALLCHRQKRVVDDCAGELGGYAFLDDCGVCSGGSSGHIANSDQDCQGTCFGDAYVNGCDEDGDGYNDCVTPETDTCEIDCNGDLTPDDCSDLSTPGCAFYDD